MTGSRNLRFHLHKSQIMAAILEADALPEDNTPVCTMDTDEHFFEAFQDLARQVARCAHSTQVRYLHDLISKEERDQTLDEAILWVAQLLRREIVDQLKELDRQSGIQVGTVHY